MRERMGTAITVSSGTMHGMGWNEDIVNMAGILNGIELEYAWSSYSHNVAFCKEVGVNRNLSEKMRAALCGHKDAKVRSVFAGRNDLTDTESKAMSTDKNTSVVAAWLENHPCDVQELERMVALERAGVVDAIIKSSNQLPITQSPLTLAACVRRLLEMNSEAGSQSLNNVSTAIRESSDEQRDKAAELLYGTKARNLGSVQSLSRALTWHQRSAVSEGGIHLLLVLAEAFDGNARKEILHSLNSELSSTAGSGIPAKLAARVSALLGDRADEQYAYLSRAARSASGQASVDVLTILADSGVHPVAKAEALAQFTQSGGTLAQASAGGELPEESIVGAIGLLAGDDAINLLAQYLDRGEEIDTAWKVSALLTLCDTHTEGGHMLAMVSRKLPQKKPSVGWWSVSIPTRLLPDVPLALQTRRGWGRALPDELYTWLLRECSDLVRGGLNAAEVNAVLDGLYTNFPGTPRELIAAVRDTLAPAA